MQELFSEAQFAFVREGFVHSVNTFIPESDQFQISPAASPAI